MARTYAAIDSKLADFLESQPVFFVATAPLSANGHVNCSPKGNDGAFQVLDEMRVAYRDLTGSGVETIAHLRENGRIVLMFCAFSGVVPHSAPPRTSHGRGPGRPLLPGTVRPLWGRPRPASIRSCRCGESVNFVRGWRSSDVFRAAPGPACPLGGKEGAEGLATYRAEKNVLSLDGLAGIPAP